MDVESKDGIIAAGAAASTEAGTDATAESWDEEGEPSFMFLQLPTRLPTSGATQDDGMDTAGVKTEGGESGGVDLANQDFSGPGSELRRAGSGAIGKVI